MREALTLLILCAHLSVASHADNLFELASKGSYLMFNESCAKQTGMAKPSAADVNAAFVRMAKTRTTQLNCGLSQVDAVSRDPDVTKKMGDDLATKIALLIQLKKLKRVASSQANWENSATTGHRGGKEIRANENQITADEEAFLASIPFSGMPKMHDFIRKEMLFYDNRPSISVSDIQASINANSGLPSTLRALHSDLVKENEDLDKGVTSGGTAFSTSTKESLAQDGGLFDPKAVTTPAEKSVACSIDSTYGQGAKDRDNILLATQFGLTIGSVGMAGIANKLINASTSAALTSGVTRAGLIMARTSLVMDMGAGAIQVYRACGVNNRMGGLPSAEKCESVKIQDLKQDSCITSQILFASGVVLASSTIKGLAEKLVEDVEGKTAILSRVTDAVNMAPPVDSPGGGAQK